MQDVAAIAVIVLLLLPAPVRADDGVDPYVRVLMENHIEPRAESIDRYLCSLRPGEDAGRRIAALIERMGADDYFRREEAMHELMNIPAIPRELLDRAIESDDAEIAWRARRVCRDRAGFPRSNVLHAVLRVIDRKGLPGLAGPVLANVGSYDVPALQAAARDALRATVTQNDAGLLRRALGDEDPLARRAAAETLAKVLGAEAIADLRPLLGDKDPLVRVAAARALAAQSQRESLAVLGELLDSEDRPVRARAVQTLRAATGKWFDFVVNDPRHRRAGAAEAWRKWIAADGKTAPLRRPIPDVPVMLGRTLVCFRRGNLVIEIDARGKEVWRTQIVEPVGCHGLLNGHRLIASYSGRMVVEYDESGAEVWRAKLHARPFSVRRLAGGTTLVACTTEQRVIELGPDGSIVWQAQISGEPMDARRLENGHTLVALQAAGFVVELDSAGKPVWTVEGLATPRSAQRLAGGNTLIVQTGSGKIIEVDRKKNVVWSIEGLAGPFDAQRLAGGTTLVVDYRGYQEVDRRGKPLWRRSGADASAICRF